MKKDKKNENEQLSQTPVSGSACINELKDLLCEVSQLIQGWNATEKEWSDWDKQVQSRVHKMQKIIDPLVSVHFQ